MGGVGDWEERIQQMQGLASSSALWNLGTVERPPEGAEEKFFTFACGSKYLGQASGFTPHGIGTWVWKKDGAIYTGEFKDGHMNGRGKMMWSDGDYYNGDFIKDCVHGEGEYVYNNGNKYVGGFKRGQRHGEGTMYYCDGSRYVGWWFQDKRNGTGIGISKKGKEVPGFWEEDKLVTEMTRLEFDVFWNSLKAHGGRKINRMVKHDS